MKSSIAIDLGSMGHVRSPPVGHIAHLDGLRAVAIGIVMISHAGLDRIVPGGFGVSIFFFLSGYLITTLMRSEQEKTGKLDLSAFYLRRFLRIMPPLWITLLITAILMALVPNWPGSEIRNVDWRGVALQVFFTSNYADLWAYGGGIPHMPLWSLAVEEHFYIVFPLFFVLVLARMTPKSKFMVLVAACAVVLLIRILYVAHGVDPERLYYWSHTRADSIIAGAALAVYRNPALDGDKSWNPGISAILFSIAVLLLTLLFRDQIFRQTIRYTLQCASIFIIFSYILRNKEIFDSFLDNIFMRRLGIYSYSLYLCHLFFLTIAYELMPNFSNIFVITLAYGVALIYAAIMYEVVDKPLAVLRRSLHRSDRAATLIDIPVHSDAVGERRQT